jgi:hypothetical protein
MTQQTLQQLQQQYIAALKQQESVSDEEKAAKKQLSEAEAAFQQKLDALLEQDEELAQLHQAKQTAEDALQQARGQAKIASREVKKVDTKARDELQQVRIGEDDDLPDGFKIQRKKTLTVTDIDGLIQAAIRHNHSLLTLNEAAVQDWLKLCSEDEKGDNLFLPDYLTPFADYVDVGFKAQPTIYKSTLKKLELPEPVPVSPTGDSTTTADNPNVPESPGNGSV